MMADFAHKYMMFTRKLGSGASGVVYEGGIRGTGESVAIKIARKVDEANIIRLQMEAEVLRKLSVLRHNNILYLHDVFEDTNRFIFVVEYAAGGDLIDRITKRERYTENCARDLLVTLCEAVRAMHSVDIIHRDLKPDNILLKSLNNDSDIKIADFGLATIASGLIHDDATLGTLQYAAPEMLNRQSYGKPVDIWSLGVMLFILLSGTFPFDGEDPDVVAQSICEGTLIFDANIWVGVSEESQELIRSILQVRVEDRLSLEEILAHPWMVRDKEELDIRDLCVAFHRLCLFNAKGKLKSTFTLVRSAIRLQQSTTLKRKRAVSEVETEEAP